MNIKSLFKRFNAGTLVKNVASLSLSMVVSQIVLIISSPILTRFFSPAEFGVQSIFVSISMVITIVYTLQYDMAIVLPKETEESGSLKQIAIKCSLYGLFIFLFIASIIFFFGLHRIFIKSLSGIVLLLSVLHAWILSVERVSNYSNIRDKRFTQLSVGVAAGSIIATIVNIITGYFWGGSLFLIFAVMLKSVISTIIQNKGAANPVYKMLNKRLFSWSEKEKKLMGEYSAFPRYRMLQNLLNTLSQNLPSLMFAAFFNSTIAGFYALARRIIHLPALLISNALRKVYYQNAAELKNNKKSLFKKTLQFTIGLSILGLVPYGVLIIFSRPLFSLIFGSTWKEAGYFASWLGVGSFFGFINVPSVSIIPVLGLQKENFIFEVIIIISRIISILIGVFLGSPRISLIIFSTTGAILNSSLIFWIHRYLYNYEKKDSDIDKIHAS
ncbi:MAG: oligosaccharide flippase family protein [Spirochaetales bacterium]|nr:oligosaccharide flippase family protein [Spirochaetales bacterium]